MTEFQHATELFMWLQVLAAVAWIAIIAGVSAVLLVPGFMPRFTPHARGVVIGASASALAVLVGVLPFYAVGAEGKITAACAAVMSDIRTGKIGKLSQSRELMVKSLCGEDVYDKASS